MASHTQEKKTLKRKLENTERPTKEENIEEQMLDENLEKRYKIDNERERNFIFRCIIEATPEDQRNISSRALEKNN